MEDPKRRGWLYLITGVVAVAAALFFMSIEVSVFDWAILGLGVVAIYQGGRELWKLRGGDPKPKQ